MPEPRSWQGMWAKYAERLKEQTGDDLDIWNARIRDEAPDDEAGLKDWLNQRSINGYVQQLLVMERFGYPEFLQTSDEELIDNQYADREHLRPILDHLLALIRARHPDVEVAGRKTYVPLFTPRRQFAVIKATTRSRVDLGLRLDDHEPVGRLLEAKRLANDTINVRIPLSSVDDIDDEVGDFIQAAWELNS